MNNLTNLKSNLPIKILSVISLAFFAVQIAMGFIKIYQGISRSFEPIIIRSFFDCYIVQPFFLIVSTVLLNVYTFVLYDKEKSKFIISIILGVIMVNFLIDFIPEFVYLIKNEETILPIAVGITFPFIILISFILQIMIGNGYQVGIASGFYLDMVVIIMLIILTVFLLKKIKVRLLLTIPLLVFVSLNNIQKIWCNTGFGKCALSTEIYVPLPMSYAMCGCIGISLLFVAMFLFILNFNKQYKNSIKSLTGIDIAS